MTLYIIGSGMAGLLAANLLAKHRPTVLEAQPFLPNNHGSILRFGSSQVSDVLGIPFRKVNMVKATLPWRNPVADAMAYAKKNLGKYESDRSVTRGTTSADRWIAPQDLIAKMASDVSIKFGINYDFKPNRPKVISTIPMPTLMDLLEYPRRDVVDFRFAHGVNVTATIDNCDAFVTLNVPDPDRPYSRVSVTGNKLIVEFPNCKTDVPLPLPDLAIEAAALLGISNQDIFYLEVSEQKYHKIAAIDETERRNFIHWASAVKGVAWQVGRFATWRPGLQLDDLVKDVRLIERWMSTASSGFEMERHLGNS